MLCACAARAFRRYSWQLGYLKLTRGRAEHTLLGAAATSAALLSLLQTPGGHYTGHRRQQVQEPLTLLLGAVRQNLSPLSALSLQQRARRHPSHSSHPYTSAEMSVKGDTGNKTANNYQGWNRDQPGDGSRSWSRTLPSVLALVLSLFSLASCVYLNVRSGDLEGRMWAVEHGKSGEIFHVPGLSVDQLNSIVQEKVDRLLSQVWRLSVPLLHYCMLRSGEGSDL